MLWMTLSLLASRSQDSVEATAVPPPSWVKKAPVARLAPQAHLGLMCGQKKAAQSSRSAPGPRNKQSQSGQNEEAQPVRTVVSSVYDPTTAAVAAKQHAKAAWEAVKQIQAQNSKTRPIYEVASMTGDLIQIMKGPPGPQGAPGEAGAAGAKGKLGPPGVPLREPPPSPPPRNSSNSTATSNSSNTSQSKADDTDVEAPLKKAASLPMYFAAFGASVAVLLILYRSIDAIIVTGPPPQ
mmetsp:Transcript_11039/g.26681  ORF Transcript_11039/g.26681 Transcript_11039/m.26681 type:complete len:238 (-) Transcript_11039:169-882(-)